MKLLRKLLFNAIVLRFLVGLGVAVLAGCQQDEKEIDLSEVSSAAEQLETRAEAISNASDDLTAHVDEFDSNDWRSVVPEIRDDAANIEEEVRSLESEVDDLKSQVDDLESELRAVRCVPRSD